VLVIATLPTGLALSLVMGAGVIRQGPPLLVAVSAGAVVVLPGLALAGVTRQRLLTGAVGVLVWSCLVITGFSIYFPGERSDALAAGISVFATPLGLPVNPDAVLALEGQLPQLSTSIPRPPLARILEDIEVPLLLDGPADGVVLPFDGEGRSMSVPLLVEGATETEPLWMLFDTGATLTTMNLATLQRLGVAVPEDGPEVTLRTASGERTAKVALIERVWLGGLEVVGVTVAVCEECADEKTTGLLGLNISGRFRVTVDGHRRELILQPRPSLDHAVDLSPWLSIRATAVHWSDGRIEVSVGVDSVAPRSVSAVEIEIRCDETFTALLENIPAYGSREDTVALPLGTDCTDYTVAMRSGLW
jgi:clan AA aspartic protease (TIGR02281 family)